MVVSIQINHGFKTHWCVAPAVYSSFQSPYGGYNLIGRLLWDHMAALNRMRNWITGWMFSGAWILWKAKTPAQRGVSSVSCNVCWYLPFQPIEWHCEEVDKGDECSKGEKHFHTFSIIPASHLESLLVLTSLRSNTADLLTIFILQNSPFFLIKFLL